MKLIIQRKVASRGIPIAAVGWAEGREVAAVSDDHMLRLWDANGNSMGPGHDLGERYATAMDWFPSHAGRSAAKEYFVASFSDGHFGFVTKSGKIEKLTKAHTGACLTAKWSPEGSALATAGEDGLVIIWSRAGVRRSTVARAGTPVYDLCWSPDGSEIAYVNGADVVVKGLRAGQKPVRFRAHEGACTLCLDWSAVTGTIVTGGDDGTYRLFDPTTGREAFCSSPPLPYAVTAVAWSPPSRTFAIGSYDTLRVCDGAGFLLARRAPATGSIYSLAWARDGTRIVAGGASGTLIVAGVSGITRVWGPYTASVSAPCSVRVVNSSKNGEEGFDDVLMADPIAQLSIGYDHLVVGTETRVCVCSLAAVHTHVDVDITCAAVLLQSSKYFFISTLSTVGVYSYDGRSVTTLALPRGFQTQSLGERHVRVSDDFVVILDPTDLRQLHTFELPSGRRVIPVDVPDAAGDVARATGVHVGGAGGAGASGTGGSGRRVGGGSDTYRHGSEIVDFSLSQSSTTTGTPLLSFIDASRSLYLLPVRRCAPLKLSGIAEAVMFHRKRDMLIALVDGELVLWPYPYLAYIDFDLFPVSRIRLGSTSSGTLGGTTVGGRGPGSGAGRGGGLLQGGSGGANGGGVGGRKGGGMGGSGDVPGQFGVLSTLMRDGYGVSGNETPLDLGPLPSLVSFEDQYCTIRRSDGVTVVAAVSPYISALHTQCAGDGAALIAAAEAHGASVSTGSGGGAKGSSGATAAGSALEGAVRLCRFIRKPTLWASLVGMAFAVRDWEAAEVSYAALGLVDKIDYLAKVRSYRSTPVQDACIALFCRRPQEAIQAMLRGNMFYRAIKTHLTMFNFKDALRIAMKKKEYLPLVLWYRTQFLDDFGRAEQDSDFKKANVAFGRVEADEVLYLEACGDADERGQAVPAVPEPVQAARERRARAKEDHAARKGRKDRGGDEAGGSDDVSGGGGGDDERRSRRQRGSSEAEAGDEAKEGKEGGDVNADGEDGRRRRERGEEDSERRSRKERTKEAGDDGGDRRSRRDRDRGSRGEKPRGDGDRGGNNHGDKDRERRHRDRDEGRDGNDEGARDRESAERQQREEDGLDNMYGEDEF